MPEVRNSVQLSVERVDRWSWFKAWQFWISAAFVTLWAGVVYAVHTFSTVTGQNMLLCVLRRTTGIPCPTCGSTRAVFDIASGQLLEGFLHNPLVVTLLLVAVGIVLMRFMLGKRVSVTLNCRERKLAWATLLSLIGLNWWYVIHEHRLDAQSVSQAILGIEHPER